MTKTTSIRLTEELHARITSSELTIPQLIERGLEREEDALRLARLLYAAVREGGRLVVVQPGMKITITS
jgi:predicted DNA-binding protein